MKIGILAVQGDFDAHAATLARMGVDYVFVRTPRGAARSLARAPEPFYWRRMFATPRSNR